MTHVNMDDCKMLPQELLDKLGELGISTHNLNHKEVFTVEEALSCIKDMKGIFAKNLFLRDKKKSLWLYCAPHYVDTKLNELARQVGAPGGLRFADEDTLFNILGVRQGCVTVFGLINDSDHKVKLILDKIFWEEETKPEKESNSFAPDDDGKKDIDCNLGEVDGMHMLYFHPLINSSSTGITINGLKAFLAYTGHVPTVV